MVTVTEKPLTFTWTSVMMTTSERMERGEKESGRERGGWAGEKRPGDKCDNGRLDLESDRGEADVVQN
jgi:hypothetical protein